jgi:hypothetical protein
MPVLLFDSNAYPFMFVVEVFGAMVIPDPALFLDVTRSCSVCERLYC